MKSKFILFILSAAALLALLYAWVKHNNDSITKHSREFIYSDITKVPYKKAALLLGTSKYLSNGHINYFYKYRIDAAVKLFNAHKVSAIVVSGDNGSKNYDESTAMHDDLVKRGIPSKYIAVDYAGFRTLDSIIRAKAIFSLDDYIIVSQRFHLERAIYLAHAKGQKAVGFVAKDFKNTFWAKRMQQRELLARAKAFLDIYILHTKPKFYGPKVKVNYKPIPN